MVQFAVDTFTEITKIALPIALVFNIGGLIVSSFLHMAFGGKLWFGK